MKRFFLNILNKFAAIISWKWLYFVAGIGLLSSIESCKPVINRCYSPAVREKDTIVEPTCYDMPAPIDTTTIEEPTDDIKFE